MSERRCWPRLISLLPIPYSFQSPSRPHTWGIFTVDEEGMHRMHPFGSILFNAYPPLPI
jgi:hypothetical protein